MASAQVTYVSSGEEPIYNEESDDTMNDCDEYPDEAQGASSRNARKVYELYKPYESVAEAQNDIKEGLFDSFWMISKKTYTVKGQTIFYQCKKGSRTKEGKCPKVLQLIVNESTGKCTLMHSLDEHRHNKKKYLHGLTPIVQAKVIEFEEFGMKPAQMIINLRKFADKLPAMFAGFSQFL